MSSTAVVMQGSRSLLTLNGWYALPEDKRGEWTDGALEEAEVTDFGHEQVVAW